MSNSKRKPASGKPITGRTAVEKRLAAQRAMAAASGARAVQRKRLYSVLLPVLVVVIVVAVLVIVKVAKGSDKPNAATPADAAVTAAVTGVPASVLDAIGAGTGSPPRQDLNGAALTANGLPRVLYVGAEWCPYCAAERWALAVALSRFGTLTDLGETKSAANDSAGPNTPTLSFHGAKYSSKYISFTGAEIEDGARKALDKIDAADDQLFTTVGGSGFPFIDVAGKYYFSVQYDPKLLAGKTHQQIADALSDKSSAIAKAADGSANILTAGICDATGDKPAAVCDSAGVVAAKPKLVVKAAGG